jgi:hypothetical protein
MKSIKKIFLGVSEPNNMVRDWRERCWYVRTVGCTTQNTCKVIFIGAWWGNESNKIILYFSIIYKVYANTGIYIVVSIQLFTPACHGLAGFDSLCVHYHCLANK